MERWERGKGAKAAAGLPHSKQTHRSKDRPLQRGAEVAGGGALESEEALGKFGGGQAALAAEPAKEVRGGI